MFCNKCGKPNDDDALFCEFCGAQLNNPTAGAQAAPIYAPPAPVQAPMQTPMQAPMQTPMQAPMQTPMQVPAPMQAPVYAAAAAPKKSKKGVAAVIISVAVLAIAAALYIFLFMNKGSKPKLTVNGKNIPVELAVMGSDNNYVYVGIAGKSGDEVFLVSAGFSKDADLNNTTINSSEDYDNCELFFEYQWRGGDADDFSVKIDKYVPNEYIKLTISGKSEIRGETYEFKVSGKFDYYANYEELGEKWVDDNKPDYY